MAFSEKLKSARVVIAIDFGTSRSGFAFACLNKQTDKPEILPWTDWPGAGMGGYPKTLTQILYDPDGKAISWGYDAQDEFTELDKSIRQEYQFFKYFKMQLKESSQRTSSSPYFMNASGNVVRDKQGNPFLVLNLVADYLRYLKEFALEKIQAGQANSLKPEEIIWCLTVPAIWTNADKQLMRNAAQKAGICSEKDRDRLMVVLEPEAAAIYSLKCNPEISESDINPGSRFMTLDCGGGTVDITVHEVMADQQIKELVSAEGDGCGSKYINDTFRTTYLDKKLGIPGLLDKFYDRDPRSAWNLMNKWEEVKCNFDPSNARQRSIDLGAFESYLEDMYPTALKNLARSQDGEDSRLVITSEEMHQICRPTLDKLIEQVDLQLQKLDSKGCDFIFMVGGFSKSITLQNRVKHHFNSKVKKVIVPSRPESAVLQGAVALALDPTVVRSRCTRLTYGCGVASLFIEGKDPEEKKFFNKEREAHYCNDRFQTFVEAGSFIEINQKVAHTFSHSSSTLTSATFGIYTATAEDVRYYDEENKGIKKVASLTIPTPDLTGGLNRQIQITFYFGRAEIEVEGFDLTTKKTVKVTVDFSYD